MNKSDVDVNVNGQAVDVKSADNKASEKCRDGGRAE